MAFDVASKQRRGGAAARRPSRPPAPWVNHVPGKLCTTGKKKSFQVAGCVLINPVLNMKLAKTVVAFGVVE
jgi:hypothetical protein